MSEGPLGYRRWRAIRERAYAAHVAAAHEGERLRAIEGLFAEMQELRRTLDEDDAAVFDSMLRRDHETLMLAEASVYGRVDHALLRAIARREFEAGRLARGDALLDARDADSRCPSTHLAR